MHMNLRPAGHSGDAQEINMNIGAKPELRWVPKHLVFIDKNYQRDTKPAIVRKILAKFDWMKFGCLSLVEQPDGRYSCLDGQNRWTAALAHPGVEEVPGAVVKAETLQQEAAAFLGINRDRTAVTVVERYWAGLTAGDAAMIRIRDVLAKAGCAVVPVPGPSSDSSMTNAVAAIERAIGRYGDKAVANACMTLKLCWPKDGSSLSGTLIQALARIYRSNSDIDPERMVNNLRAKTRHQLTADAENMRKIVGGAAETALAKTLVEIYNKGLSKNMISYGVQG
jgi:hypothetical protein